ncbi:hypothetical protein OFN71_21475, partial [Escherichia coli]|nr:hypothetical protein [Escherichia coli]
MREQIKQDIDLIEILFYLKKKIRVILFIMAICMAMVLLFLYINKDNIKVIYSLKINQTTPGILVGNDSNLLIVFYVQIMPDDFVMQLHR